MRRVRAVIWLGQAKGDAILSGDRAIDHRLLLVGAVAVEHAGAGGGTIHRGHDRAVQLAQPPQERMKTDFQRLPGIALAGLLVVAALQIGAGAERAAGPCQHQATHLIPLVVDRIERLGETTQHVHRDRVHDLLMIELENGDLAIEIERNVLELHCFLATCVYALFHCADQIRCLDPYLILSMPLSMVASEHLPATGRTT